MGIKVEEASYFKICPRSDTSSYKLVCKGERGDIRMASQILWLS